MPIDTNLLDQAFEKAQCEILGDMAAGIVPTSCQSFSHLHDYVDANAYGGLFDIDLEGDDLIEFGNALQDRLHRWLSERRKPEVSG